jgi:6-phosphofructokinase 1
MKKVAILTSGGDAPGMNACIRAAVRAALNKGIEPYVVYDGYKGLVEGKILQVHRRFVSEVLNRGGTIIGTARLDEFKETSVREKAITNLHNLGINDLVVIGGDGSFRGASELCDMGLNCIGVCGSIDNDINAPGYTIGFDSALNTIVECIDRIRDTSSSHTRCSIVEVMGRHCGDLALYSSIACGADILIDANTGYNLKEMIEEIKNMKHEGRKHVLIVVSENILDVKELAKTLEKETGFETRATILGYLQRGGTPSAMDRVTASVLGYKAIEMLEEKESDKMVYFLNNHVYSLDLKEAVKQKVIDYKEIYKVNKIIG